MIQDTLITTSPLQKKDFQDRVKSALSYIDQAQTLLDKGGY